MYLYKTCNVKWGTQNINFKVIIQHENDTCHVQSLETWLSQRPCIYHDTTDIYGCKCTPTSCQYKVNLGQKEF